MKKNIYSLMLFSLAIIFNNNANAQNVGISTNGATPNASAMLDVSSTDKGVLIPRVALSATNSNSPIGASITTSLLVYNTATAGTAPNNVLPGFYYWDGSMWISFGGSGGKDWSLTGNAGTTAGTNFIGTTDAIDFVIKTNNSEVARVTSGGKVGIGLTPSMKLDVTDASTTANDATIRGTATGSAATFGVLGSSSSATGQGIFGFNSNALGTGLIGSGNNIAAQYLAGGSGGAFSSTNVGVYGYGNNTAGSYGAFGVSINATGVGVFGNNTSTTGSSAGVVGICSSPDGDGVYGSNNATSGTASGVGVFGTSAQANGVTLSSGIYGTSSNTAGTAVIGLGANTASGYTSASGAGGAFTTRAGYGVMGTHFNGTNGDRWGFLGASNAGVYGAFDATHFGYIGRANHGAEFINNATSAGTSYAGSGVRAGVYGYNICGANYNFGISGFNGGSTNRTGAVHGAYTSTTWSSMGYQNSGGSAFGLYATAALTTGVGFLSNNSKSNIGIGSYGDLIGSWTRGEVMGHISSGELFSSYNLGDEYTSGHQIELVETNNEKTPAYSVTSTEIKIYADGKAELNNGIATVKFSDSFIKLLGDNPNITVTPIGESEGLHIKEITKTGFTVKENKNGTSSVQFTWIAVGNRIDDKDKSAIPSDLTDKNFNKNMKEVMFNESDTKHSAKPIWWDGSKIRFDALPKNEKETFEMPYPSNESLNVIKANARKPKDLKKISEK
jgi:hypothetical protein